MASPPRSRTAPALDGTSAARHRSLWHNGLRSKVVDFAFLGLGPEITLGGGAAPRERRRMS